MWRFLLPFERAPVWKAKRHQQYLLWFSASSTRPKRFNSTSIKTLFITWAINISVYCIQDGRYSYRLVGGPSSAGVASGGHQQGPAPGVISRGQRRGSALGFAARGRRGSDWGPSARHRGVAADTARLWHSWRASAPVLPAITIWRGRVGDGAARATAECRWRRLVREQQRRAAAGRETTQIGRYERRRDEKHLITASDGIRWCSAVCAVWWSGAPCHAPLLTKCNVSVRSEYVSCLESS